MLEESHLEGDGQGHVSVAGCLGYDVLVILCLALWIRSSLFQLLVV